MTVTSHEPIVPFDAVSPASPVRPLWQRTRLWVALAVLILLAGFGVALIRQSPARPLDPDSPGQDGSRALSVLLAGRGTRIHVVRSLDGAVGAPARSTVVIAFPDEFDTGQLSQLLRSGHRLIAVDPDPSSLTVLAPGRQSSDAADSAAQPGCSWPGAQAAGEVDFPGGSARYTGNGGCYDGRVVITDSLVLLGTAELLTNHALGSSNTAALAVNAISDDGHASDITWLMPGDDARGGGTPGVFALFPTWSEHAFWWLLAVGALVALWQGRRLGPLVTEPLPVIVRSAEVVEGHGRLYRRAGARDRAAAALRTATMARLAQRLGLHRGATPPEIAAALTAASGRPRPEVLELLGGADPARAPAPADDAALLKLARSLTELENGTTTRIGMPTSEEIH